MPQTIWRLAFFHEGKKYIKWTQRKRSKNDNWDSDPCLNNQLSSTKSTLKSNPYKCACSSFGFHTIRLEKPGRNVGKILNSKWCRERVERLAHTYTQTRSGSVARKTKTNNLIQNYYSTERLDVFALACLSRTYKNTN